jgi:hypothetical protein
MRHIMHAVGSRSLCGLTGTLWAHGHACTGMHDNACRPRHVPTHTYAIMARPTHNVTELFTSAPGPRWDCADTGPHPRRD